MTEHAQLILIVIIYKLVTLLLGNVVASKILSYSQMWLSVRFLVIKIVTANKIMFAMIGHV